MIMNVCRDLSASNLENLVIDEFSIDCEQNRNVALFGIITVSGVLVFMYGTWFIRLLYRVECNNKENFENLMKSCHLLFFGNSSTEQNLCH